ncbi:MAG: hypothetical protein AABW68_01840 [archaeon]
MNEKPTPLFLIIAAGVGTAILSPFVVEGAPFLTLIIPFALLAARYHGTDTGVLVGVAGSALAGLLTNSLDGWNVIGYALASGIAVLFYAWVNERWKGIQSLVAAALIGAWIVEIAYGIQMGGNRVLQEEWFLGTTPLSGLRILFTGILTLILSTIGEESPTK